MTKSQRIRLNAVMIPRSCHRQSIPASDRRSDWRRAAPRSTACRAMREARLKGSHRKRAAEAALKAPRRVLLRCTDLKDRPRARELNQWPIRWIGKTGVAAGPAAGVPHRAVIDDIG